MTIKAQVPVGFYDTTPTEERRAQVEAMSDVDLEDAYAAALLELQLSGEERENAVLRRERAEGEHDLLRQTLRRRIDRRAHEQAIIKRAQLAAE